MGKRFTIKKVAENALLTICLFLCVGWCLSNNLEMHDVGISDFCINKFQAVISPLFLLNLHRFYTPQQNIS